MLKDLQRTIKLEWPEQLEDLLFVTLGTRLKNRRKRLGLHQEDVLPGYKEEVSLIETFKITSKNRVFIREGNLQDLTKNLAYEDTFDLVFGNRATMTRMTVDLLNIIVKESFEEMNSQSDIDLMYRTPFKSAETSAETSFENLLKAIQLTRADLALGHAAIDFGISDQRSKFLPSMRLVFNEKAESFLDAMDERQHEVLTSLVVEPGTMQLAEYHEVDLYVYFNNLWNLKFYELFRSQFEGISTLRGIGDKLADFYADVALPMLINDINEMLADPFLNSGYEIYSNFGKIFQMVEIRDFIGNESAFKNLSTAERTASREFIDKKLNYYWQNIQRLVNLGDYVDQKYDEFNNPDIVLQKDLKVRDRLPYMTGEQKLFLNGDMAYYADVVLSDDYMNQIEKEWLAIPNLDNPVTHGWVLPEIMDMVERFKERKARKNIK